MFLSNLTIENFRGIKHLSVELDDVCVIIGENNCGKSTIIDALRICLTRSFSRRANVFDEYDFRLSKDETDPSKAPPIEITLKFAERKEDEWSDDISQLIDPAIQVEGVLRSVNLKITGKYDPVVRQFAADYDFLDLTGNKLVRAKNPRILLNIQQLAPAFYLASLRDAASEFKPRSQFWGPFVRSLDIDEEKRIEIEAALADLNKKVLDGHKSFEMIKLHLEKTAKMVPLDGTNPVFIEAMPSRAGDILSKTQINLASKSGAKIPIIRHGSGTQSLAVICLFDAFLRSQLEGTYSANAEPILALEEPEAHLHPSAARAVGEMLQNLTGQKIITTHSGDLLASVPLSKLRRLRRKSNEVCIYKLEDGILTEEEINKLNYQIRSDRGCLLFAKCWLLVEGETEGSFIAECARIYGCDLFSEGISCIEFSQVGVEKYIKLADQLGIEWFVLSDKDDQGEKYQKSAEEHLQGRDPEHHMRMLEHGTMEVFLCMEGYGAIYEAGIAPQKQNTVKSEVGTLAYWNEVTKAQSKNAKPKNVMNVAQEIAKKGREGIPTLLAEVFTKVEALARGAS